MAHILQPPTPIDLAGRRAVFLAGSIEMGQAEHWQRRMEQALADLDIVILNPRRDDWDSTWKQSITDDRFREQVEWELDGLEQASVIAIYFAPETKSPVTLLELGLVAGEDRAVVCCPEGFWRRGNVEIVCRRFGIPMVPDLDALAGAVRARLVR